MGEAVSVLAYPVIQFSQDHLEIVHDDTALRRCTRAGVRNGWYDGLVIVDCSLRRWPATLVGTRADRIVGWLTGRLIADLELDRPETVELEDVRQRRQAILQQQADLWDADGQLDLRLEAVRRADNIRQLIGVLQINDPDCS